MHVLLTDEMLYDFVVLYQKKDALPGVGKNVLKDGMGAAPKVGGKTRKGKNCPANMEHSDSNKIGTDPASS